MTEKVPLSALAGVSPADFDAVVQVHAENVRQHESHVRAIAAGEERQPYPAPHSLPIVDRCVRRPDLAVDYEIIDDGPTPAQKLRARKDELLAGVFARQGALLDEIAPPGKRPLLALEEADALEARAASAATAKHEAALKAAEDRKLRSEPIFRRAAALCAEIEDLTEETIKGWKGEL